MQTQTLEGFLSMETAQHAADVWHKRRRVLELLDDFDRHLVRARSQADVVAHVRATLARLAREQADPGDRRYLTRSITRVATTLRRGGWAAIAVQPLEDLIERGLADDYVYAEAIRNHLMLNHWETAECLLVAARQRGLSSPTAYSSVLAAYSRWGWAEKCRDFFEHAVSEQMLTDEGCGALIKAYGKQGKVDLAESVFAYATTAGIAGSECHVALVKSYAHAGRHGDARTAFDAASAQGITDPRLVTGVVHAYCKAGLVAEAESICESALEQGVLSDLAVALLVEWYAQRGHFRRAERLLKRADAAAISGDTGHLALASAYQRKGHFSAARRLRRQARTQSPEAAAGRGPAPVAQAFKTSAFAGRSSEERGVYALATAR